MGLGSHSRQAFDPGILQTYISVRAYDNGLALLLLSTMRRKYILGRHRSCRSWPPVHADILLLGSNNSGRPLCQSTTLLPFHGLVQYFPGYHDFDLTCTRDMGTANDDIKENWSVNLDMPLVAPTMLIREST